MSFRGRQLTHHILHLQDMAAKWAEAADIHRDAAQQTMSPLQYAAHAQDAVRCQLIAGQYYREVRLWIHADIDNFPPF